MESERIKDFEDFLQLSFPKQNGQKDYRGYLESSMHHYLPKKVCQTRFKFYQVNKDSLRIEDENFYVSEHLDKEEHKFSGGEFKKGKLLNIDI